MGGKTRRERDDWKLLLMMKQRSADQPLTLRKVWRFLYDPRYQSAVRLWWDGYITINWKLVAAAKPVYKTKSKYGF